MRKGTVFCGLICGNGNSRIKKRMKRIRNTTFVPFWTLQKTFEHQWHRISGSKCLRSSLPSSKVVKAPKNQCCQLCQFHTQCENFKIFLSFRFYVKSIFEESRMSKTAVFAIFGTLNFVNLINFSHQKVQKYMKSKV